MKINSKSKIQYDIKIYLRLNSGKDTVFIFKRITDNKYDRPVYIASYWDSVSAPLDYNWFIRCNKPAVCAMGYVDNTLNPIEDCSLELATKLLSRMKYRQKHDSTVINNHKKMEWLNEEIDKVNKYIMNLQNP